MTSDVLKPTAWWLLSISWKALPPSGHDEIDFFSQEKNLEKSFSGGAEDKLNLQETEQPLRALWKLPSPVIYGICQLLGGVVVVMVPPATIHCGVNIYIKAADCLKLTFIGTLLCNSLPIVCTTVYISAARMQKIRCEQELTSWNLSTKWSVEGTITDMPLILCPLDFNSDHSVDRFDKTSSCLHEISKEALLV